MMRGGVPRLLRTLWYLRRPQLAGQLRRALAPVPPPRGCSGLPVVRAVAAPAVAFLPPPAHIDVPASGRLRLIRRDLQLAGEGEGPRVDWHTTDHGPLFAYHLHQHDWLRHPAWSADERLALLEDWRTRHRRGTGWEPFPISLRAFAWAKLLTTSDALPAHAATVALHTSLADQLATLSDRLETHLLANHYLWNLMAVVLGGVLFDGGESDRWRQHQHALVSELAEQVPADGMHCERSPTYHALLLENLLDLLNFAQGAGGRLDMEAVLALGDCTRRMLGALQLLTHPDGEIALFGDSAFGIASTPGDLFDYAAALGIEPSPEAPTAHLPQAGFARLSSDGLTLLVTAAPPSPPHQPGHAHCDALSFELSIGRQRVVTDTGVAEYVPGPLRDAARATASHATAVVEGQEQAELWAAHRVGGRPDVAMPHVSAEPAGGGRIEAVCAGWATPDILQRRSFELAGRSLRIRDVFDRTARELILSLPLAPGLVPQLAEGSVCVPVEGGTLRITASEGLRFQIDTGPYFPEFGRSVDRAVLRATGSDVAEAELLLELS